MENFKEEILGQIERIKQKVAAGSELEGHDFEVLFLASLLEDAGRGSK